MTRHLPCALIAALVAVGGALPAEAAAVGVSLPKFRALVVDEGTTTATSFGGSVQVVGTGLSINKVAVNIGLDYAYTRDFAAAANYSFFDLQLGAGLPLGLTPQFYLTPAVDLHSLFFVASPQGLGSPAFGVAPRLTVGFQPSKAIRVELSGSQTFLPAISSGMTIVELGGSYSF
ncbi:MAG: hypothetical protein ACLGIN_12080 [Candidatus Sericytochromatia bacterium]